MHGSGVERRKKSKGIKESCHNTRLRRACVRGFFQAFFTSGFQREPVRQPFRPSRRLEQWPGDGATKKISERSRAKNGFEWAVLWLTKMRIKLSRQIRVAATPVFCSTTRVMIVGAGRLRRVGGRKKLFENNQQHCGNTKWEGRVALEFAQIFHQSDFRRFDSGLTDLCVFWFLVYTLKDEEALEIRARKKIREW